MKAAVQGVMIFPLTIRTHLKFAHGGIGAVIGYVLNNGKPGAAVGAVGKRVAKTAVSRRKNLSLAILAGSDIGGD